MTTYDPSLSFVTPRVAAGALFTNDEGRVLMVVPTYKDYWDIPGGYVENGEAPSRAAQREVSEEIGLTVQLGRLLVADWWDNSPENENKAKMLLVFDGGILTSNELDAIQVDQQEIAKSELVDVEALGDVTIPRLANRLRIAVQARAESECFFLENGQRVG